MVNIFDDKAVLDMQVGSVVQINQPFHTQTTRADLAEKWKLSNWAGRKQAPLMKPGKIKVIDDRHGSSGLAAVEIDGMDYIVSLAALALVEVCEGWRKLKSMAGKEIIKLESIPIALRDQYCRCFGYFQEPPFTKGFIESLQSEAGGLLWTAFKGSKLVEEIEKYIRIGQFFTYGGSLYLVAEANEDDGDVVVICMEDGQRFDMAFDCKHNDKRISVSEILDYLSDGDDKVEVMDVQFLDVTLAAEWMLKHQSAFHSVEL